MIDTLRKGEAIIIEDVRTLRQPFFLYDLLLQEGIRSWLHAPLMYQGALIGALNFGAAESGTFHAEHIEIAREVANQLVIALQNAQLFALKQRALSRMEILHEIDQAILTAQSPQATAQAALDKMRPLIGCLRASVSLFDFQANEEWLLAVSTQLPVRFQPNTRTPLEQFGPRIVERLQHQQPFVIEDVLTWLGSSPAQQQLAADGIQSWLYTPLVYQGELIGSLNLGDTQANPFGLERIEIAREVADQIAIAVQQARLFEQVTATRDQLQALSHRLVDAQEAERRHIARELHDEIGQSLTGLKLALQMILRLSPETIPARVNEALKVVNDLMAQVHQLSLDLRPMMLDDLGLVSALLWLFEHYTDQTGVHVHSEFLRLENRLPPQVETTAYRIVQEALTNVARHAGVKEVWVRLLVEDSQLRLQIQDTGVGFNVPAALSAGERLGVAGMQERAALLGGWLQVDSQPGLGTQVTALLPFRHDR